MHLYVRLGPIGRVLVGNVERDLKYRKCRKKPEWLAYKARKVYDLFPFSETAEMASDASRWAFALTGKVRYLQWAIQLIDEAVRLYPYEFAPAVHLQAKRQKMLRDLREYGSSTDHAPW